MPKMIITDTTVELWARCFFHQQFGSTITWFSICNMRQLDYHPIKLLRLILFGNMSTFVRHKGSYQEFIILLNIFWVISKFREERFDGIANQLMWNQLRNLEYRQTCSKLRVDWLITARANEFSITPSSIPYFARN